MNPKFRKFQIAMRRSSRGKVLGVFRGIAESQGFSICATRFVGIVVLLFVAGAFGVDGFSASVLAVGFFYLLLAMLMRPPLDGGERDDAELPRDYGSAYVSRRDRRDRPAAVPYYQAPNIPPPARRVDLHALDRQLDSLNRRIQRMETIVTDRQYDWDRRMNTQA